jgi:hypothetical protein
VFTGLNGDPMAPDRLTRTFTALVGQAGLPPVRLHDLRHGAATLALAAGVDLRTVQDMLGHSSIVLTADTLHLGSARRRPRRRREGRDADHQGRLPRPRHPPPQAPGQTPAAPKTRPSVIGAPVPRPPRPPDRPPAPPQPGSPSLSAGRHPRSQAQQGPQPRPPIRKGS